MREEADSLEEPHHGLNGYMIKRIEMIIVFISKKFIAMIFL